MAEVITKTISKFKVNCRGTELMAEYTSGSSDINISICERDTGGGSMNERGGSSAYIIIPVSEFNDWVAKIQGVIHEG